MKCCYSDKMPFIAILLMLILTSTSGWTRQGDPPPLSLTEPALKSMDTVTVFSLPAIDQQQLLAEDAQTKEPAPLRYALPKKVSITPKNDGVWETLADGGTLWRQRIICPGATDINVGFNRYQLPEGAKLYVINQEKRYYEGPYEASDNREHGQLWLPVIPGENALIELYVPADQSADVQLELSHVGCGYRSLFNQPNLERIPKQGSCNIDTICSDGNGWRDQIRSVARYSINGSGLCTGTLMRDAPGSFRNFFLTANHCELTSSSAPTVVVYWNYQSPSCGQLSGGSLAQNQTGASFRASRSDVDMALIELNANPSSSFNVFYSGWDRSGNTPAGATGIHHPNGDEKAISFDNDALSTMNSCIGTGGINTHWRVIWNRGITEPGSSGSGIWEPANKRLIGFLSGGGSSCATPTDYDCYGKLSVAWDGSSASSRLRDWLDPNNTGTTAVDGANPGGGSQPDLVMTTITSPSTGVAGGTIDVSSGIKNQGGQAAGSFLVGLYLSTDSTITTSDIYTGWGCRLSTLAAGESSSCGGPITIPASIAAGTYYFGAYADSESEITESSETNNGLAASNRITISSNGNNSATILITHYYTSILERGPDAGGLAYWQNQIAQRQALGLDVKPVFRDMAYFFFNSAEYLARNTTNTQYITNLYLTFFQRTPDAGGMSFWLGQLATGMSRNDAMSGFLYSTEFTVFMQSLGF